MKAVVRTFIWMHIVLILGWMGSGLIVDTAHAQWTLIEDFNSLMSGDIAGQRDWSAGAHTIFEIATDPSVDTNQVLEVLTNRTSRVVDAFNNNPNLVIPEGATGTLFFRFRAGGSDPHINLGLSDLSSPGGAFRHFEVQVRSRSANLDARNGREFTRLESINPDEWYSVWMVIDNEDDTWQLYIQSVTQFPVQTELTSGPSAIEFRNGTGEALSTFFIRSNSNHNGPWYLDDIYLDQGQANTSNPLPIARGFVSVDDFESHDLIDIAGQGAWSPLSDTTFEVASDPTDNANAVLSILDNPGSTTVDAFNNNPALTIPEGKTGTLFFRLYLEEQNPHVNFGLSDVVAPGGRFEHFEAQLRTEDTALDARDGGSFAFLSDLNRDEWFQVWMVIDNASDTWTAYAQSADQFPMQTELTRGTGSIDFRNGTSEALKTFFVRNSPNHNGPWYMDDIKLDPSGENLTSPLFVLVENFESHVLGAIGGQGDWSPLSNTTFEVATDPSGGFNQVLSVLDNTRGSVVDAFNNNPNLVIPEGATGTLFFRFRAGGSDPHINLGLSDLSSPGGAFRHFEVQVRSQSANLDARNGREFTRLESINPDEWYSVWMVIDNEDDTWQLYIQSVTQFPVQTELTSGPSAIEFRNGTGEALSTFFIRSNPSHNGPWYLDDIYLDARGHNLASPVHAPQNGQPITLLIEDLLQIEPPTSNSPPLSRINVLREVPDGSGRLFVNDLRGPFYVIVGGSLSTYMDLSNEFPRLKTEPGRASGFVSFAFHPEFATNGLFYTAHSEHDLVTSPPPNLVPPIPLPMGHGIIQHSVLTEFKATDPAASVFSGTQRELMRIASPHPFHNIQEIAFNPYAQPADSDYGLLYIGSGDFGIIQRIQRLGEDEQDVKERLLDQLQRLDTVYGSILRIDPLGGSFTRGETIYHYGIPPDNPFVDGDPNTFDEIYAYGFRNAHRLAWDPGDRGHLFVSEIGQDNKEEINLIIPGANYGWPYREGNMALDPLVDPDVVFGLPDNDSMFNYTYPVAQYDHSLGDAIAGGFPVRDPDFPELDGRFIFGDIVSGRMWYAEIAELEAANDGNPATLSPIHDVNLLLQGQSRTLRSIVKDALDDQGIGRTDLRFATDLAGNLFITTKQDGFIRTLRSLQNSD